MTKILIDEATVKLALDALEPFITPNWAGTGVDEANAAYTALREALAEQPDHHDLIGDAQDKLIAEQAAQPYKGIADHSNQVTNGRMRIDPVTGDVGIGTPSSQPMHPEIKKMYHRMERLSGSDERKHMKTLIEMAREAGAELAELPMADAIVFGVDDLEWNSAALQRFALLVCADEREACAKVCDRMAQPAQQEPYGWHTEDHLTDRSATTYSKDVADRWKLKGWPVTPFYTAPQAQPAQRTWVGLTDEEIAHIADSEWEEAFVRMIETKLKEKNT